MECGINFRSLRAGLNHSEERSYTGWLPVQGLAINWDVPAVSIKDGSQLSSTPEPEIEFQEGRYRSSEADFQEFESEIIDQLIRKEKLRIFFNPVFGLFSLPGDPLEDFLARIAEAALGRVEPELGRLRSKFELQLEQIREANSRRGQLAEGPGVEKIILRNLQFFESENRITAMFSTLAGSVFGTTEPRSDSDPVAARDAELREDLVRVEQEASQALRRLYEEYLSLANEHDVFDIGLQPDNIQVIRSALLWVPVSR